MLRHGWQNCLKTKASRTRLKKKGYKYEEQEKWFYTDRTSCGNFDNCAAYGDIDASTAEGPQAGKVDSLLDELEADGNSGNYFDG